MKNLISINLLVLCMLFLFATSCKEKKVTSNDSDVVEELVVKDRPMVEEDGHSNEEITVRCAYTSPGALINVPVSITQELTYRNGKLIKDKSSSGSGNIQMTVTQEFDDKQRMKSLKSERSGEVSVLQTDTYSDDDLLLSEHRIEKSSDGYDTTLFEYIYPADRPNPMKYYRTNNGKKVTEFILTKKGNQEIVKSISVGSKNYTGISTTTKIKNDNGDLIEENEVIINSDWMDKTKLDTTVMSPIYYEYDDQGRVIKTQSERLMGPNGTTQIYYHKNGVVKKKVVTKKGRKQTIVFKRVW